MVDLCSGAGGSAMGFHRAGFEVVCVDIKPQPRNPFEFHQADAFDFLARHSDDFDAFGGAPPCQRWSDLARRNGNAHMWPDLLTPMRAAFQAIADGRPWVIENVEGAPLIDPVWLCGTTFPELRVIRHRGFESSVTIPPRPCTRPHPLVYTRDKRKAHYGRLDESMSYVSVNGGGNCSVARARVAMGIPWMTKDELNEAIPPAYTEHVGQALLRALVPGAGPPAVSPAPVVR